MWPPSPPPPVLGFLAWVGTNPTKSVEAGFPTRTRVPFAIPVPTMPPNRGAAAAQVDASQPSAGETGLRPARGNANSAGAPRGGSQHAAADAENVPPLQIDAGTAPAALGMHGGGAGSVLPVQKLSPVDEQWFNAQGRHAGHLANSAACKGDVVVFSAPDDVKSDGAEAVAAWRAGFMAAFKPAEATTPAGVPVTAARKRRRSSDPEEPRDGRAGLESAGAKAELSLCVYEHVRRELFLPSDDLKAAINTWLKSKGYTYEDAEYDAWWIKANDGGHFQANRKAIAARASVVAKIKEALWRQYSASRRIACVA